MGEINRLLKLSQKTLIPLPETVKGILETLLLKSEREFLELINRDSELSSLIISVANQPKYRKDNPPVQDVRMALLILGEDMVKILVLSYVSTKLSKVTFNEFSFSLFWARAIANLCFSFICAFNFEAYPSHLHISSYLMDFGIIVLYSLFPEGYLKVLKLKKLGKTLCQAEREVFEVDHATIGSEYFESYNFPRRFVLNIRYHHQFPDLPEDVPPKIFEDVKFLNFIDLGVGCYFSVERERKFKNFKNFGKTYFNLNDSQIEKLLDSLPEWTNVFYEIFNYKDYLLTPYTKWIKLQEEKLKIQIKKLEEQKKKEENLIELYQDELAKVTREKEVLIEEIETLKNKLEEGSILDPLTGLYNESYFLKRLKEELLRAKRYRRIVSILLIEVDKFSQITELYGVEEEENILKLLAQEFLKNLRRVDIVAKLSKPEQFAVILPETPLFGAMVVARKLLRIIERTFYQKYNTVYSPYIAVISYDPSQLDPKTEPQLKNILNTLKSGIDILKLRGQKRIVSLVIDKELNKIKS
ncbi:MAG: HDOD domain-containing protein [Thermodesulfobacterium sp.]|nr:HDOD domain-containing protein [Thermodesulfobacterium sp.]